MKKLITLMLISTLVTGCATTFHPTVPEGYSGPTATIKDHTTRWDQGKADLFFLSHIDGREIKHSLSESLRKSYGKGNVLHTVLLTNTITAEKHIFTIMGRTVYAMPIRALAGTVYELKGDISFTPKPNEAYIIKGKLSEGNSTIWIENISTGKVIEKIELKGSAELGFFEK
jgi:hypothetical protein